MGIIEFFKDLYDYSIGGKTKTIDLHSDFESLFRENGQAWVKAKIIDYTRLPEKSSRPEYLFGKVSDDKDNTLLFKCDCEELKDKNLTTIINYSLKNDKVIKLEGKIDREYTFNLNNVNYL